MGESVLLGGFPPAAFATMREGRTEWLSGYVRTYLERDLQMLSSISQLSDFRRLLRIAALRTGKIMNQSEMARDAGLSQSTAHRYLGLLEVSHLLHRLPAFAINRTKRLVKSPRLFFCDSGLACHLAGVNSLEELVVSDSAGFLYENLVLQDMLAWCEAEGFGAEILYWRTTDGKEVDFVIERRGMLVPFEVKAVRRARIADTVGLNSFLAEYSDMAPHGILLYGGDTVEKMSSRVWAVPLRLALGLVPLM